jgi:DNA-binding NarL/FixJ family response regulator
VRSMDELRTHKQLRLVIVSDQVLFRASLARLLASETSFAVALECGSSDEALEYLRETPVDVVLLDITMGGEGAKDLISAGNAMGTGVKFLLMAESLDNPTLASSLKIGASGIFRKSEAPERLVLAIQVVAAGAVWLDQNTIQHFSERGGQSLDRPSNRKTRSALEEREATVIRGIMEGLTTRKIGSNMGLPESKIKNILQGLFAKTGVRKRSQLVRLALEGSLLPTDDYHAAMGLHAQKGFD